MNAKDQFIFGIFDEDIGDIVDIEAKDSKFQCYDELRNILYSFEKLPDEKEDLTHEEIIKQLQKFNDTFMKTEHYSYWLPGHHRLIFIKLV